MSSGVWVPAAAFVLRRDRGFHRKKPTSTICPLNSGWSVERCYLAKSVVGLETHAENAQEFFAVSTALAR